MYDLRYNHAEVVLTRFRSISSKMSLESEMPPTGIKGWTREVVASTFEPNLAYCRFDKVLALDQLYIMDKRVRHISWFDSLHKQQRLQSFIKLAYSQAPIWDNLFPSP